MRTFSIADGWARCALQIGIGLSARNHTACCLRYGWIIDTTHWRLRRR